METSRSQKEEGNFSVSIFLIVFLKAGFIAVFQTSCLSVCFGFKESPEVKYGVFTPLERVG